MSKGIQTTLVVTSVWFPNRGDFPTDADLLKAAYHDAQVYQEDPEMFIREFGEDTDVSVTFSIVEE